MLIIITNTYPDRYEVLSPSIEFNWELRTCKFFDRIKKEWTSIPVEDIDYIGQSID